MEVAIHNLYEYMKAKIITKKGFSKFFGDIGVKQGFMLSPTLFEIYIDKLEEWIN